MKTSSPSSDLYSMVILVIVMCTGRGHILTSLPGQLFSLWENARMEWKGMEGAEELGSVVKTKQVQRIK